MTQNVPSTWREALDRGFPLSGLPLPPPEEILNRLEVLSRRLEDEGRHVAANTVALAIEAIRRAQDRACPGGLLAALKVMVETYREGCADEDEPSMVVEAIAAIDKAEVKP